MAKWWKFGLGGKGKDKDREEAPAPPTSTAREPEPPAPAREKSGGFFGRLFGRGRKKGGPAEEAPAEAPPQEAPAPEAPLPSGPEPGGETPEGGEAGEAPGGGEEGEEEEEEEDRVFPSSVTASVDGTWVISESVWHGVIYGSLHGADAKAFILAIEKGREHIAIRLLANAYDSDDMGFARYLDIQSSTWGTINYS
ncbi:predicted protein [Streptomyces sp. SPB78]|uniref:hypothetical protein n=1 Tax=Streptomyces sp. (strain SPB78) TaxID=591157 RepID=UPI0001B54A27|nr:hypothetical protein [Streptomyces sp. SPB78]EFL04311.1 predicted protein [Streptomyces sp. SPB78]